MFVDETKRWNVAVEFSVVFHSGIRIVSLVLPRGASQYIFVLSSERDVHVLCVNISFWAVKCNGMFPELFDGFKVLRKPNSQSGRHKLVTFSARFDVLTVQSVAFCGLL